MCLLYQPSSAFLPARPSKIFPRQPPRHPKPSQDGYKGLQDPPRCLQDGPKTLPRCAQDCRRPSQDSAKASQDLPRCLQDTPRPAQDRPWGPPQTPPGHHLGHPQRVSSTQTRWGGRSSAKPLQSGRPLYGAGPCWTFHKKLEKLPWCAPNRRLERLRGRTGHPKIYEVL